MRLGSGVECERKKDKPQVGFEHTTCRLRSGCSTNRAIEAPVLCPPHRLMRTETTNETNTFFRSSTSQREKMAEEQHQDNDPSESLRVGTTCSVCCEEAKPHHFCSHRDESHSENTATPATSQGTAECSLLGARGRFAEAYSLFPCRRGGTAGGADNGVIERSCLLLR